VWTWSWWSTTRRLLLSPTSIHDRGTSKSWKSCVFKCTQYRRFSPSETSDNGHRLSPKCCMITSLSHCWKHERIALHLRMQFSFWWRPNSLSALLVPTSRILLSAASGCAKVCLYVVCCDFNGVLLFTDSVTNSSARAVQSDCRGVTSTGSGIFPSARGRSKWIPSHVRNLFWSRNSWVDIVMGYRLDDRGLWVRFALQTGSGFHPMCNRSSFPGVKRLDHWSLSSSEGYVYLCLHSPIHLHIVAKEVEIHVTCRGGPYGCETSRLARFLDNRPTDSGEVSLKSLPAELYTQENSWFSFMLEAESTPRP
jgi:hypothetical protein